MSSNKYLRIYFRENIRQKNLNNYKLFKKKNFFIGLIKYLFTKTLIIEVTNTVKIIFFLGPYCTSFVLPPIALFSKKYLRQAANALISIITLPLIF